MDPYWKRYDASGPDDDDFDWNDFDSDDDYDIDDEDYDDDLDEDYEEDSYEWEG